MQPKTHLDIAELYEVEVKIVSCALVHSVGDEHFLVAKVVERVDRISAQRVHFSAITGASFVSSFLLNILGTFFTKTQQPVETDRCLRNFKRF
jgi:hypothetical protein